MNKLIGILGCGGGVGQYVVNYLKGKYPLKCGQRKIVNMNADTDIEYVQVDVRNRKELIKFCQNCSIVINCTGPSYYLSREIASVVCEHNIDYIDTFGIGIDKEELYNYESTMIIGAGSFPGLSGILPVWIRKEQQESEIRRVNIFAGGNEHITASACADFLLSTFSQFGKIDSYYSHQQIKKTENITERVPLIFPDTAEIMEYLPDEIYLSAEYSRIDELHWYNVQTNSEYRNIIQEALLKLMISQEYEYVNRLAENVKRKLENKREESKTWYRIWLEIETVTEKKNYGFCIIYGSIYNIPICINVQNQMDPSDPENSVLLFHKISLYTECGNLTMIGTNSDIMWEPRIRKYIAADGGFHLEADDEYLDLPVYEEMHNDEGKCFREMFSDTWPDSIKLFLEDFYRDFYLGKKMDSNAQFLISVCQAWKDLGNSIGSANIIHAYTTKPIKISEIVK